MNVRTKLRDGLRFQRAFKLPVGFRLIVGASLSPGKGLALALNLARPVPPSPNEVDPMGDFATRTPTRPVGRAPRRSVHPPRVRYGRTAGRPSRQTVPEAEPEIERLRRQNGSDTAGGRPETIADRINTLACHITSHRQLAIRAGIPVSSIYTYAHGRVPPADVVQKLAEGSGCSAEWLLTGRGEMFPGAAA
jgi:hypothetical protein